jgi:TolB protein
MEMSVRKCLAQRLLPIVCGLCILAFLPVSAVAQTDIFVRGAGKAFPVALPVLCLRNGQSTANLEVPDVIGRNLNLTGTFEVLPQQSYVEAPGKCNSESFAYSDWSIIGAEGLVKGEIEIQGNQLVARMFLHDVSQQRVVLAKEYRAAPNQARIVAYKFANEIMKYFTGEEGIFGTRLAYSSRVGRFKELFMMDMDGSNVTQMTDERGLAMSAAWKPDGSMLAYTSYKRRIPELFLVRTDTKAVRSVTNGPLLELGAKFSPDGQFLASQSNGKDSDIVLIGDNGQVSRRLTRFPGVIDVSPSWSPDHSKIAFCSNRAGGPQIYVMGLGDGDAKRISFMSSNYCTSPDWSPKGDKIAFVCRADGGFQVFTANPDGSSPLQLTSGGDNEDPSWSPDGRYLTFASTFGSAASFRIAMMLADGSNVQQLSQGPVSDTDPAWGPKLF